MNDCSSKMLSSRSPASHFERVEALISHLGVMVVVKGDRARNVAALSGI